MKPLIRVSEIDKDPKNANHAYAIQDMQEKLANEDKEMWKNDKYTVIVNRNRPVSDIEIGGEPLTMCWLSIRRNDRQAIPDWRDFQWIKNQLVGEECEGCEIYPAESRLVDGANQFHMWVFENPEFRFPFGFNEGRIVTQRSFFGEVQRPFPQDRIPPDLKDNEKKVEAFIDNLKMKAAIANATKRKL